MIKVTPKPEGFTIRSGAFYIYVSNSEAGRVADELTRTRLPRPHDAATHIAAVHDAVEEPVRELQPAPDYGGFLRDRRAEWAAFADRAAAWEAEHPVVA